MYNYYITLLERRHKNFENLVTRPPLISLSYAIFSNVMVSFGFVRVHSLECKYLNCVGTARALLSAFSLPLQRFSNWICKSNGSLLWNLVNVFVFKSICKFSRHFINIACKIRKWENLSAKFLITPRNRHKKKCENCFIHFGKYLP